MLIQVKIYVNRHNMDFMGLADVVPTHVFELPIDLLGTVEINTSLPSFSNVSNIAFYFPYNHGEDDMTAVQYIGMQGEHTHHR